MGNVAYSWSDKLNAVQLYMLNGNMRIVAEATGVHPDTLADWKRSSWWPQAVEELRQAKKAKLGTSLGKIIDTSLEVIQDRLEKGDFVMNNKTGKIERRKVSLRDAATVTNNLLTRQLQMEEIADRLQHNKDTVQETLQILAKEFKKMNKQPVSLNVEDAVVIKDTSNAIYEERKTGLQEGSDSVHIETGSEEEAS